MTDQKRNWRDEGVRIVRGDQLDSNTPQSPGMTRATAINNALAGAKKIWAGLASVEPNAKTAPHHHGSLESVVFVLKGKAQMRWGERLEYVAEANPGDFIFIPPFVPHQELNGSADQPLECVVIRSDQEPIVVNLKIDAAEKPEEVSWVDPSHPKANR
jgi:uncharacterized RmlC-like cupin family protein